MKRSLARTNESARNAYPALSRLVSPHSWEEFTQLHFGKRPVHLRGAKARFENVFSFNALDNVLNSAPSPHPALKLHKQGRPVPCGSAQDIRRSVSAGATLILENVDRYHAGLGALLDEITAESWIPARLNLYLSQPDVHGYNIHYDTHDFLILQIDGHKEWEIYPATTENPVFFQKHHDTQPPPASSLVMRCELAPGDVLYVPRGFWHGATARREPSLHLTLALFMRTGVEFLLWLADELREDVRVRRSFPFARARDGWFDDAVNDAWRQGVANVREAVLSLIDDPAIVRRFATSTIGRIQPRSIYSLSQNIDLENGEFRLRSIARVIEVDRAIVFHAAGQSVSVPLAMLEAARMIASGEPFSIADLADDPGEADKTRQLVRALISIGLVCAADSAQ